MNQPLFSPDNAADELRQQLAKLQQQENTLDKITSELNNQLKYTNQILSQQVDAWTNHREEYFKQLTTQLRDNGIDLTEQEQAMLRQESSTESNIQTVIETLEQQQIKTSAKDSDFAIVACSAIVAALSRNLQKIDPKAIKDILKKIPAIDAENKAANNLRAKHATQHQEIIETMTNTRQQITDITPVDLTIPNTIKKQLTALQQDDKKATATMKSSEFIQ